MSPLTTYITARRLLIQQPVEPHS